jgi:glycosyltransferase involved in cell wall biosynthesis
MENKFPKFSVLMTVYKKEKSENLDAALGSIENQSVVPNEIVLVEDGPIGKKLEDVVRYHQSNFVNDFKVVKLIQNSGRGVASRKGISFVSNDWIARADSDDISKNDRFELQLKAILKDSSLKMVGGQVQEFLDGDINKIIGERNVPLQYETIRDYAKYRSPINNPSIMFKKSALADVGGYPLLNVMEDYDLCVKFIIAGFKIINLPKVLVNMRVSRDLYNRRGGIKYLFQYIKLKIYWKKQGVGNTESVLLSSISMTFSVILPAKLREGIYRKILHRIK